MASIFLLFFAFLFFNIYLFIAIFLSTVIHFTCITKYQNIYLGHRRRSVVDASVYVQHVDLVPLFNVASLTDMLESRLAQHTGTSSMKSPFLLRAETFPMK